MEINSIHLQNALPAVFTGAEKEAPVSLSEVWLHDLTFRRGDCYLIEAESGTGKSSLCSFIYGNRNDYSGHIYFNDTDLRSLRITDWCDIRRRSLALLPQDMRLFPQLTALENVQIKNRLTGHLSDKEIAEMFERLEIPSKLHSPARLLSIGQQQRVAIIRALAQPFSFILLDEPVSHLDSRNNNTVAALILEHARRQGAGIITTSVGNPLLLDSPTNRISL